MRQKKHILLALLIVSINSTTTLLAQNNKLVLSNHEKQITIDSICNKLMKIYVFPDVAINMAKSIQENFTSGNYESINNPDDFADELSKDLYFISQDKHIRVDYNPEEIAYYNQKITAEDSLNNLNQYIDNLKRENFGFKEVKILNGNIGYLDLRSFSNVDYAKSTAVAAMNFLSNSDAIIVDLRMNGGGMPSMIQLISSYLFSENPVHLNNFYWRQMDSTTQSWTLPEVDGIRSPTTPVYILTSNRTFSAAEEFSYNLKNLNRAILIGETTGGGAHPGSIVTATDNFTVWIPSGRAINPITNTNWEGTGVTPHVKTTSQEALGIAHIAALETLLENCEETQLKHFYEWNLIGLKATVNPITLDIKCIESHAGVYGSIKISVAGNKLLYQKNSNLEYELIPINKNEFMLQGNNSFRIKFIVEDGETIELEVQYENGRSDRKLKTI